MGVRGVQARVTGQKPYELVAALSAETRLQEAALRLLVLIDAYATTRHPEKAGEGDRRAKVKLAAGVLLDTAYYKWLNP